MKRIESRDNKWVKRLNGLKIKKNRDKEGVFVAEGLRFISEVPAEWEVEAYAVSESFADEIDDKIPRIGNILSSIPLSFIMFLIRRFWSSVS